MANLNQWLNDYSVQLFRQNNGGTCEHCRSAAGHMRTCKLLNNNGEIIHLGPADTMNPPAVESDIDRLMADRIIAHAWGVKI